MPRVSADFSYTHRSFHNFFINNENLNRHAGGTFEGSVLGVYETYMLTAPVDARLPDGGGYPITTYVATPAANAIPASNYQVREDVFGDTRKSAGMASNTT